MEQDLIVMVARSDQLMKKTDEIRARGLEVVGMMHVFNVIYVKGDPRKLEGMAGVKIRKAKTMRALK